MFYHFSPPRPERTAEGFKGQIQEFNLEYYVVSKAFQILTVDPVKGFEFFVVLFVRNLHQADFKGDFLIKFGQKTAKLLRLKLKRNI